MHRRRRPVRAARTVAPHSGPTWRGYREPRLEVRVARDETHRAKSPPPVDRALVHRSRATPLSEMPSVCRPGGDSSLRVDVEPDPPSGRPARLPEGAVDRRPSGSPRLQECRGADDGPRRTGSITSPRPTRDVSSRLPAAGTSGERRTPSSGHHENRLAHAMPWHRGVEKNPRHRWPVRWMLGYPGDEDWQSDRRPAAHAIGVQESSRPSPTAPELEDSHLETGWILSP